MAGAFPLRITRNKSQPVSLRLSLRAASNKGRKISVMWNFQGKLTELEDKAAATGFVGTRVEQMTAEKLIKLCLGAGRFRAYCYCGIRLFLCCDLTRPRRNQPCFGKSLDINEGFVESLPSKFSIHCLIVLPGVEFIFIVGFAKWSYRLGAWLVD